MPTTKTTTSSSSSSPTSVAERLQAKTDKSCIYDLNPTVLYKLIEFRAWDEVLDRLLQKPAEAETWVLRCDEHKKLKWKMLPLHAALLFRAPLKVIQALLRVFSEAVEMMDDRHMFPIHIACSLLADAQIVRLLIDACPAALLEKDSKNRTPQDVLMEAEDRHRIKALTTSSSSTTTTTTTDKTLLHAQALRQILLQAMQMYQLVAPVTTKENDDEEDEEEEEDNEDNEDEDRLEDHHQQNSHATPDSACGILEQDYDQQPTKLTQLLEDKQWEQVLARCKKYPQEVATWMCRYDHNKVLKWKILPIHSAVVLNAPKQVLRMIMDTYPPGVFQSDDRNMLPIHMAFRLAADLDICNMLLQAYPNSLLQPDQEGVTPKDILNTYHQELSQKRKVGAKITPTDRKRLVLVQSFLQEEEDEEEEDNNNKKKKKNKKEDKKNKKEDKKNKIHKDVLETKSRRIHSSTATTSTTMKKEQENKNKTHSQSRRDTTRNSRTRQTLALSPTTPTIENIILNQMNQQITDMNRCGSHAALEYTPSFAAPEEDQDYDDYNDQDSLQDSLDDDTEISSRYSNTSNDPDALFYNGMFRDIGRMTLGGLPDMFLCGRRRKC